MRRRHSAVTVTFSTIIFGEVDNVDIDTVYIERYNPTFKVGYET